MQARAPELSTAPFMQSIADLTAKLKKQRKAVRGNGCLKRQQSTEQLRELDFQLSVLKKLNQKRANFLDFYEVATISTQLKLADYQVLPEFDLLMKNIINYGGERYALKLQLTRLAAVHN